jgi:hypothetical protein
MILLPVIASRIRPLLLLAPLFSLTAEAQTLAISFPGPRQPVTLGGRKNAQLDESFPSCADSLGGGREKKVENHEVMLHFACGSIVWNKSLLG